MRGELAAALDSIVEKYRQKGYFTQASYGVFQRDKISFLNTCGGADRGTSFDLASLTKIYTTFLILRGIQEGKLSLAESPLGFLEIPASCKKVAEYLSHVTVEQLMTHTSGLCAWYPFYVEKEEFYQVLEKLVPKEKGSEEPVYSDLNYMLLGKAAEGVWKMELSEAVNKIIAKPLGMESLAYYPPGSARRGKIAVSAYDNCTEEAMCRERGLSFQHFRKHGAPICGEANDGNCWYYFQGISGHAGLFSNAEDVCRFGMFFLNEDSGIFAQAQKPRAGTRGLGFDTGFLYPGGCGHTGFTGTSLYLSVEKGVGAVLLTNRLTCAQSAGLPDLRELRRQFHEKVEESTGVSCKK
nr:serine hydrolase domain-containing protein [uncultured Acetatifactor sp.]